MIYDESIIDEVIDSPGLDFPGPDLHPGKLPRCERCGEVELVPGSLLEIHHGPGCHEGFTELLCLNCHQRASFYQGFYPEETRKKDRNWDGRQSVIWLAIFDRLACLYPGDPSVSPWIFQQKTNLEKIYEFDARADMQARTQERKIRRLGCESPECKICGENDVIVLTDKAPKNLSRFIRRTMGLKGKKTILCLNCLAKLPFAQAYWSGKFRRIDDRERSKIFPWLPEQTLVTFLNHCLDTLNNTLKCRLLDSEFIPWIVPGIRLPCELVV